MTESQKRFEEWARKEGLHVNFIACDCFYDVRATETAWQAWQASRAAIVVKLGASQNTSYEEWQIYHEDEIKDELERLGVRYE